MAPQPALKPRTRVVTIILVLMGLALAPTRFTSWLGFVRDPLMAVLAPISGPASAVSRALRPGGTTEEEQLDAEALARERDEYKRMYLLNQQRVDELELLVKELQSGVEAMRAQRIRLLEGARIGTDLQNGTIEIARGSRHGVREGSIVIARNSQQIVGVVTSVNHLTCTVRVLTDQRFQPKLMRGIVMPTGQSTPEALAAQPRLLLVPAGDGTLVTDRQTPMATEAAEKLVHGQEVRLQDDSWPSSAQMLVLGKVESVEYVKNHDPAWRHVRVRPSLDNDLIRVGSVIILIPIDDTRASSAAAKGGTR